ncbi:LysR family transcriptional regulator [Noviherbaspirillum aridicola]|uniref:LysR family transcriptional regulator n=1 Tax=Noviherbaspirillum aridicola TaxID=2849687 RepID=A0ABQ4Q748_9BURK|nr:LysR family transcriptional regulator [Noviherbaspirillum aridicola]GIZ53033.1 LysR family transcriptional regulator [Noviherbaspirillum aridicola]
MDKLQAMEVFVQVVDAGSFTRAADIMKLPKATVSTLVANLETTLSVRLLNRTTRRISLTADGAAYYERCLGILSDVREAEDALSKTRVSPSGRLRVDVPTGLGRHLLVPALPDFLRRYPDIHLELGCSDRPVDLLEEGVDCVLRGGELADSSLIARRVASVHFVTCAAPSYIALHGRPTHPDDLLNHECVNYFSSKSGKIMEWDFARGEERVRIRVPGRIAVNDSDAYMAAVLAGMGVAQMAASNICPFLQSGQLELVLEDWCVDPLPLHIMYPQNRHLSAKVRVFVEWVAELLADHPAMQIRAGNCPLQMAAQEKQALQMAPAKTKAPALAGAEKSARVKAARPSGRAG